MKKEIMNILYFLFVLALYAGSVINLLMSVPNGDTYKLTLATLLYIIASKYEKLEVLEESEE